MDFKKNLKIQLGAVGKMYIVCALLTNAHTCLYKSTTSPYFDLDPPSLEEYITQLSFPNKYRKHVVYMEQYIL